MARLSEEEKARRKAVREAERAARKAEKEAQKQADRQYKADRVAAYKENAIREALGGFVELPALKVRGMAPMTMNAGDAFRFVCETVNAGETLVFDTENTGYSLGHRDYALQTIQMGTDAYTVVWDAEDETHLQLAGAAIRQARTVSAHNAAADNSDVAKAGLIDIEDVWAKTIDTATLAKLADPALTGDDAGLKDLGPNVLGSHSLVKSTDQARSKLFKAYGWKTNTKDDMPPELSGWAMVDKRCGTMVDYAATDVLEGAAVLKALPRPSDKVLTRERGFQRFCGRVSYEGIATDREQVYSQIADREPVVAQTSETLRDMGLENPGSPPQVGKFLIAHGARLKVNDKGNYVTDKKALKDLLVEHQDGPVREAAEQLLSWRKQTKLLSATLYPFRNAIEYGDGRIYPTIYTLGADTGRTSCVRPNVQQVPKAGGMRECLVADPGYVILACDFSQVEVRVGAGLSRDANLKHLILNGLDLHKKVADLVYGEGQWSEVDKVKVKIINFTKMFGGSVRAMARGGGCSIELAQRVSDQFDGYAPDYAAWCRRMIQNVKMGRTQYETYSGRIIHLDKEAPHKAMNYPVQGSARELAVDTALLLQQRPDLFPSWRMIVHDEWVVQVPEDKAEEAGKYLLDAMTTEFMGIPIAAELDPPTRAWQSAKE